MKVILSFNRDVDLADVAGSQDLPAGPLDVAAQSAALKIVQMGSVTPAEDFQALIQQGLPLEDGKNYFMTFRPRKPDSPVTVTLL